MSNRSLPTMSAGWYSIIQARGHMVDYLPSAERAGVTEESWNLAYAQELLTAIEGFDASGQSSSTAIIRFLVS